jgi:hypothetical protein
MADNNIIFIHNNRKQIYDRLKNIIKEKYENIKVNGKEFKELKNHIFQFCILMEDFYYYHTNPEKDSLEQKLLVYKDSLKNILLHSKEEYDIVYKKKHILEELEASETYKDTEKTYNDDDIEKKNPIFKETEYRSKDIPSIITEAITFITQTVSKIAYNENGGKLVPPDFNKICKSNFTKLKTKMNDKSILLNKRIYEIVLHVNYLLDKIKNYTYNVNIRANYLEIIFTSEQIKELIDIYKTYRKSFIENIFINNTTEITEEQKEKNNIEINTFFYNECIKFLDKINIEQNCVQRTTHTPYIVIEPINIFKEVIWYITQIQVRMPME